jgi:Asp-tRNA(Asn)/Glu-tRNA(Gln) amidotransferase A subunit family amidase
MQVFTRWLLFFAVSNLVLAHSEAFDPREATIDSVHQALFTGQTTCRIVVASFLARIEAFNPAFNAIITLNPDALKIADEMDKKIAEGKHDDALFCIPIMLKDNYNTAGMNTTGGCLALGGSQPTEDAPVTAALKGAGAIVLGKTNLHEMALEGLSVSSLGGQSINPYDHTRTPGGSSGGTGISVASSFSVFGTGAMFSTSVVLPCADSTRNRHRELRQKSRECQQPFQLPSHPRSY